MMISWLINSEDGQKGEGLIRSWTIWESGIELSRSELS